MILNGTDTTPTSSYPYHAIGPVDFSQINFVRTEQVDYYYGDVSGTQVLLSTVTQTSDPAISLLCIGGIMILFLLLLGYGIKKIRKMGK